MKSYRITIIYDKCTQMFVRIVGMLTFLILVGIFSVIFIQLYILP